MQFFVFWLNIINFSVDIKFIITRKFKKTVLDINKHF